VDDFAVGRAADFADFETKAAGLDGETRGGQDFRRAAR
jgi:hypothetical protein